VQAELRRVGLAREHDPGGAPATDQLRVVLGDVIDEEATAAGGRRSGDVSEQILREEGDPAKGAGRELPERAPTCALVEAMDHRAERGVEPLDPLETGLSDLAGVDLPVAEELCEAEGIVLGILGECGHGPGYLASPRRWSIQRNARLKRRSARLLAVTCARARLGPQVEIVSVTRYILHRRGTARCSRRA